MDRIQSPLDRIVRLIGSAKERQRKGQDGAFEQALEQECEGEEPEEQQLSAGEPVGESRLLNPASGKTKKARSPDGKGLKVDLLA